MLFFATSHGDINIFFIGQVSIIDAFINILFMLIPANWIHQESWFSALDNAEFTFSQEKDGSWVWQEPEKIIPFMVVDLKSAWLIFTFLLQTIAFKIFDQLTCQVKPTLKFVLKVLFNLTFFKDFRNVTSIFGPYL